MIGKFPITLSHGFYNLTEHTVRADHVEPSTSCRLSDPIYSPAALVGLNSHEEGRLQRCMMESLRSAMRTANVGGELLRRPFQERRSNQSIGEHVICTIGTLLEVNERLNGVKSGVVV